MSDTIADNVTAHADTDEFEWERRAMAIAIRERWCETSGELRYDFADGSAILVSHGTWTLERPEPAP